MSQLILQPGPVDGTDTFVYGDSKNTNYGTNSRLSIAAGFEYHASAAERSLLRFDVSALMGTMIESATLTLYYASTGSQGANTYTISCYRCPTMWTELGATWNQYDGANAWPINGEGGNWDESIAAVCTSIDGPVDLTFDIKAHIEDAIANRGGVLNLLCKITGEDGDYPYWSHDYYSSDETSQTTKRPKLVIDYIKTSQGIKPSQFLRGNPARASNLRALGQV